MQALASLIPTLAAMPPHLQAPLAQQIQAQLLYLQSGQPLPPQFAQLATTALGQQPPLQPAQPQQPTQQRASGPQQVAMAYLPSAAAQPQPAGTAASPGPQRVLPAPSMASTPALRSHNIAAPPQLTPLKPAPSATTPLVRCFAFFCCV